MQEVSKILVLLVFTLSSCVHRVPDYLDVMYYREMAMSFVNMGVPVINDQDGIDTCVNFSQELSSMQAIVSVASGLTNYLYEPEKFVKNFPKKDCNNTIIITSLDTKYHSNNMSIRTYIYSGKVAIEATVMCHGDRFILTSNKEQKIKEVSLHSYEKTKGFISAVISQAFYMALLDIQNKLEESNCKKPRMEHI